MSVLNELKNYKIDKVKYTISNTFFNESINSYILPNLPKQDKIIIGYNKNINKL